MKDNIEKRVVGVYLLMLVVLGIVAATAVHNIRRSITTADWVNHTHAVILEADTVLSHLHAGDAFLRSYLLTGDKRDQGAYRTAYNEMVEHLEVAKSLTRAEAPPQQQFLQLEKLIATRVDFTRGVVQAREKDGFEGARQALAPDSTGESLSEIQRLVQSLKRQENLLLQDRDKESYLQAQATRWTIYTGVGASFLLLVFSGWLMRDDLAARRLAAAALQEANAQLEIKVQERTAELQESNQKLKKENLERRWANQAIDHQLRYSQLIINSIGELIFVVSKALNISRINPAVLHQTSLDANEIIGRPLDQLLQLSMDPISQALKDGREIQDRPAGLIGKAGKITPVRFSLVPLRDQNKVVGGVLTVTLCHNGQHQPS
jgi:CHASE3 domain sensor protein